jgi:voltage-gated potassium channel
MAKKINLLNFDQQKELNKESSSTLKAKIHNIIFESDTFAGKAFDITLLMLILLSVTVLILDTVPSINRKYHTEFIVFEWIITIFFTSEYILRLFAINKPIKYALSFFGIINVLSTFPMYLNLFFPGVNSLMAIRILRLLRIFRIFKLEGFLHQGNVIIAALNSSLQKISIFLFFIILMVTICGSLMFIVEHNSNPGFDSIPNSIYWAIVTITTVGYGDISPVTPFGKILASFIMILGYAVIAVPTGIVTSSFLQNNSKNLTQSCTNCGNESHDFDAEFCKKCGHMLDVL